METGLRCEIESFSNAVSAKNFVNSFGMKHNIKDFDIQILKNQSNNRRVQYLVVIKYEVTRNFLCPAGALLNECLEKKETCDECERK